MPAPFDPTAHPALANLGERLREEASAAAYAAGRAYLRKGLVTEAVVAGATAYATVTGTTAYRTAIAFEEDVKPTCTCPAHRKRKFCKHVVAVCMAMLERPGEFQAVEAAPAPPVEKAARPRGARKSAKAKQAELRADGLAAVDSLLNELTDGGLMALGPDKAALLGNAAELTRALKLRRLGNLIGALQRAAERGHALEPETFAHLLIDIALARQAAGAFLEGTVKVDPRLAEDLLGKTWRNPDLETVTDLELMTLAATVTHEGDFRIKTVYLADLKDGAIYADREIRPARFGASDKAADPCRLLVDEAGLYPGVAPRRIRLRRVRRAPLLIADIDRLMEHAVADPAELRTRLVDRMGLPFGAAVVPALFRPAALARQEELVGMETHTGEFLPLELPDGWMKHLPALLPKERPIVLFGLLRLDSDGPRLSCLSVVGTDLCWANGPIFPGLG